MITKEQTKMMIRDLVEEYINLSAKIDKYQKLNLDCSIVADLKEAWKVLNNAAWKVLDNAIDHLHNDLRHFDYEEFETDTSVLMDGLIEPPYKVLFGIERGEKNE